MQHGKVGCLIIFNHDMHLFIELEDRIFPGHCEGYFWLLKYLDHHEIILRDQQSALEVSHEEINSLHNLNLSIMVNKLIVKGYLVS